MNFDAKAARAMAPGQHLTVQGAPGLRLVASETKRTWTYRYRATGDGKVKQIRLGHWPGMGLPAALTAWQTQKGERDAGADPAAEKKTRRAEASAADGASMTVAQGCAIYLKAYLGTVADKTYHEADRTFRRDLGVIEHRPMASITRADAFDLISPMKNRPLVGSRLKQLLGAVWDHALDSGRLDPNTPNWWRQIMKGKLPSRGRVVDGKHQGVGKRHLSDAELTLLLPWLPNFSRTVDDALTLYLWTACRGAEITAMEREDIGEEGGQLWWTIPKAKLKMRRNPMLVDLRVPLVGRAEVVVRRRLAATTGPWVFPSPGKKGHIDQKILGTAVLLRTARCPLRPNWDRTRMPVQDWTPHDLRRTSRTVLSQLGCSAEVAEAILGHMLPGIQRVYNRNSFDAERLLWLGRLAARLEALAAGK